MRALADPAKRPTFDAMLAEVERHRRDQTRSLRQKAAVVAISTDTKSSRVVVGAVVLAVAADLDARLVLGDVAPGRRRRATALGATGAASSSAAFMGALAECFRDSRCLRLLSRSLRSLGARGASATATAP